MLMDSDKYQFALVLQTIFVVVLVPRVVLRDFVMKVLISQRLVLHCVSKKKTSIL